MLSMAFHHEHIILINLNTYLRHGALKRPVELVWRTSITTFLCFTCDVWRDAMEVWGTICKRQQCKLSCNWENQHETNEDEPKYLIPSERGHVFKNIVKLKWMLFVFWCKVLAFIFSHHTFIGIQDIKNKINGGFSYYYFFNQQVLLPPVSDFVQAGVRRSGCHAYPGDWWGGRRHKMDEALIVP